MLFLDARRSSHPSAPRAVPRYHDGQVPGYPAPQQFNYEPHAHYPSGEKGPPLLRGTGTQHPWPLQPSGSVFRHLPPTFPSESYGISSRHTSLQQCHDSHLQPRQALTILRVLLRVPCLVTCGLPSLPRTVPHAGPELGPGGPGQGPPGGLSQMYVAPPAIEMQPWVRGDCAVSVFAIATLHHYTEHRGWAGRGGVLPVTLFARRRAKGAILQRIMPHSSRKEGGHAPPALLHLGLHAVLALTVHTRPRPPSPSGPQRVAVAGQAHHRSGTCGSEAANVRTGTGESGAKRVIKHPDSLPTVYLPLCFVHRPYCNLPPVPNPSQVTGTKHSCLCALVTWPPSTRSTQ